MDERPPPASDVAFTPSVKAVQARRGSREDFRWDEENGGGFRTGISAELAAFLAERDSAYLATANADGQPYIQHRGGPKGFIRVLDAQRLAFADFSGNRQYITTGNLADNARAFLFLMDYARRRRVKLWGRAQVIEDDRALIQQLMPANYPAKPLQAIVFTVQAWDINCTQHIVPRVAVADVQPTLDALRARIAALEAELASLRAAGGTQASQ